jgi:CheY-like chemotaxis protein
VRHTLLLADDSVTIQRVIELTFADEDVDVIAVSDGDQAIARIEASPPDIVLADIGMPGKNGYEVARYIKQSPRLAHIPVVLLTGAFEPIDQARAAEAGCDGILAKPFEPQLVIGRVKDLLTRPSGSAPRAVDAPASAPPAANEDLGEYFDRLDAAFANLSSTGKTASEPARVEPPVDAAALPPIADAFAAILAAEERQHTGNEAAIWPATAPPPPQITDDLIEQIVRRVLVRLSDQVVRQTVADLVSTTAERLVREEIDRIKGAIK